MLVKIIRSQRDLVAVCDSELIGKRFEEGNVQLDLTGSFFRGDEFSREETIRIMERMARDDATFNIVGKDSVDAALEAGIIIEEGIAEIQGVPFALVLL
jgi:hypothetical protein